MKRRDIDKIHYLTIEEIRRLFSAIKTRRDKALFVVAYRHGLRASEVGLLHVNDVDLSSNRIKIHRLKGSLSGEHRMEADEARLVKAQIKAVSYQGCLFPSNRGTPISRRMLDYLMKHYCEIAGIPESKRHFHCLKHSIATHLLEAGQGIEFVQDWLGHARIENTLVYARLTSRARDEASRLAFARLPKV